MSPQETRSRHFKRALAIAGATIVAAGGTIGLTFAASSDDTDAVAAKPVTTAPASPSPPAGTHYPTPMEPAVPDAACIDPSTGGHGPQHC
jgi:hypothetical protein